MRLVVCGPGYFSAFLERKVCIDYWDNGNLMQDRDSLRDPPYSGKEAASSLSCTHHVTELHSHYGYHTSVDRVSTARIERPR